MQKPKTPAETSSEVQTPAHQGPEESFQPMQAPEDRDVEAQAREADAEKAGAIKENLKEKTEPPEDPEQFKKHMNGITAYIHDNTKSIKNKKMNQGIKDMLTLFIRMDGTGEGLANPRDKKAHRWTPGELASERAAIWNIIKTLDPKLVAILGSIKETAGSGQEALTKHLKRQYKIKASDLNSFYDQADAVVEKMVDKAGFFARRAFISACSRLSLPQTSEPEASSLPAPQSEPPSGS
jgi:hypothetical protein